MRYKRRRPDITAANKREYASRAGVGSVVAGMALARGIDPEGLNDYLNPKEEMLSDPMLFKNMSAAVDRIRGSISRGEKITVYADYDADGTSACAIMKLCLEQMGADVTTYIPDRFKEGYGTNPTAIRAIAAQGTKLIITVDCGIRSNDDVALAKELGMDVIISDHHECGELPDTPYILNPKMPGETYPFGELCGAAMAYKIAYALVGESANEFLDLAGFATIADIVPLRGENRVIASLGLKKIRENPREAFAELARSAGITTDSVKSYEVGFVLAPRVNAAGRLEHGNLAMELFTTQNPVRRRELADKLNTLNDERKSRQRKMAETAKQYVRENLPLSKTWVIVVSHDGWDLGIVGLVASALVETFNRPCVVMSDSGDGKFLTGSARSIPGVDIYQILCSMSDIYTRFGGHEQAAGLTFPREKLQEFTVGVNEYASAHYAASDFVQVKTYDDEIDPKDASPSLVRTIDKFEPFGEANPRPVFLIKEQRIPHVRIMRDQHYKFTLEELDVVKFYADEMAEEGDEANILGELSLNTFRGAVNVQMIVADISTTQGDVMNYNQAQYMRTFIQEITGLADIRENPRDFNVYKGEPGFLKELQADLSEPIGTAVICNSYIGAEKILELIPDGANISKDGVPSDTAENVICFNAKNPQALFNYKNIYLVGACALARKFPNAKILMTKDMYKQYESESKGYFADRETMRRYISALREALQHKAGYETISELLRDTAQIAVGDEYTDSDLKRAWLVVNIISQLRLLKIKKGDKIYIKYDAQDFAFEQSSIYLAFRQMARLGK